MPRGQSNPGGPRVAFPLAALAPSLRRTALLHGPPPDSPQPGPLFALVAGQRRVGHVV